uniref:Hydroxyacylglutathione hydrolase like n=1 Tax=Rhinolophus ferrumequinum TaxID=59479 RepID=A0A671FJZ9_RHIFE
MEVRVIPVLEHNYVCLVIEEHTREAVPVDMAMPKSIVGREGGSLTTVLTMHHHWDNAELARLRPGLVVLGADECLCTLTHAQAPCEKLRFGALHVCCFLMSGHTCRPMSYFLWEDKYLIRLPCFWIPLPRAHPPYVPLTPYTSAWERPWAPCLVTVCRPSLPLPLGPASPHNPQAVHPLYARTGQTGRGEGEHGRVLGSGEGPGQVG